MVDVAAEGQPVLLVCYDHPLPAPLDALRPTTAPFATALVLAPPTPGRPTPGRPTLHLAYSPALPAPRPSMGDALDALADGNAAARSLPLLAALAKDPVMHAQQLHIAYLDGHLTGELLA